MKLPSSSDKNGALAEINIIPLVDIMLVLLIIFMVAAPMLQQGIDIDLPEVSASSVDMKNQDVILSVDQSGQVFVGDNTKDKFSINSIEERLMGLYKDKPNKVIYLKADQSIKYGYIMEIMASCRRAGIEKIGMITQTPEDNEIATKGKKPGSR